MQARELDLARADQRRRPLKVALRARIVAKVSDEIDAVAELRAADRAAGLLGSMLGDAAANAAIFDPEEDRFVGVGAKARNQWVVGVEDYPRGEIRSDDLTPSFDDLVELAIAIKLVAEEVGQQNRARGELPDERREPEFINLKKSEVAALVVERRSYAASHIRASAVVNQRCTIGAHDFSDDRARRCLAVRRRDHDAAARKFGAALGDRCWRERQQDLPWCAGTAAAADPQDQSGQSRDRAGDCQSQAAHAGSSTLTASGRIRISAGSSVRGSPSA